jgi:hypothetical protein
MMLDPGGQDRLEETGVCTKEDSMSTYLFDNAAPQASQRFASLETLYDPWTIRHLETTGIGPGWQCWEIGAGSGSIAAWLAERYGPTGHVLVTDIDPRFLAGLAAFDPSPLRLHSLPLAKNRWQSWRIQSIAFWAKAASAFSERCCEDLDHF